MIRWEEPPAKRGQRGPDRRWAAIAEELRANPGVWGVVAEEAYGTVAYRIRRGSLGAGFEAKWRQGSGQRGTVYARFVGES
jgi:hypothetical protein